MVWACREKTFKYQTTISSNMVSPVELIRLKMKILERVGVTSIVKNYGE